MQNNKRIDGISYPLTRLFADFGFPLFIFSVSIKLKSHNMEIYKNLSLENLPDEEWRDIKGYEGLYQVSNMGRVKCLSRPCGGKHNRFISKIKIMKMKPNVNGYLQANLHKNGIIKRISVHRLVALAFIPKIDGKDYIDHINSTKIDNRVENLRWCTHQENDSFALAIENKRQAALLRVTDEWRSKMSESLKSYYQNNDLHQTLSERMKNLWQNEDYARHQRDVKNTDEFLNKARHNNKCKVVLQFGLQGNLIQEFYSASEAMRLTGINKITSCCRGERNKAGGYIWKYKNK